jgi:hypothetical protein
MCKSAFSNSLSHYSLLKLSTGFAVATFIAFMETVNNAIKKVIRAANAKTHQSRVIW